MKRKTQTLYKMITAVFVVALLGCTTLLKTASAAGPSIYISPGTSNIANGSNFDVSVVANTGATAINTADVTLTYDSTKADVVTFSAGAVNESPNYDNVTPGVIKGGASKSSGYPSGVVTLLTVTFHAKVGSGSMPVGLSSAGAYPTDIHSAADGSDLGAALIGGTVNFSQPTCPAGYSGTWPNCVAPTCPAGQVGTPPNCTTPPPATGGGGSTGSGGSTGGTKSGTGSTGSTSSGGTSTTPAGDNSGGTATKPTVPNNTPLVTTKKIEFTKAVITATTPEPSQMYIQYGLIKKALSQQTATTDFGTSHDITLDPASLSPGQTYYYVVVSRDANGKIIKSATQSFNTKGIDVTVKVYDSLNHPVANKDITLHSTPATAKTDAYGKVTFKDVAPGSHELLYTDSKQTYTKSLTVDNTITTAADGSQSAKPQNFSVVYAFTQVSHTGLFITLGVVGILIALVLVAYFIYPGKPKLGEFYGQISGRLKTAKLAPAKPARAVQTAPPPSIAALPGATVTPVVPQSPSLSATDQSKLE